MSTREAVAIAQARARAAATALDRVPRTAPYAVSVELAKRLRSAQTALEIAEAAYARAESEARTEYEEAGRAASEHLDRHGNVMSEERAAILRRLTAARIAHLALRGVS